MKQRVDMRIDVELLDRVDEARGETTRTAFTEAALSAALSGGLKVGPISKHYKVVPQPENFKKMAGAESRTSPPLQDSLAELERLIKAKRARGKTPKLAEIEAREELGL